MEKIDQKGKNMNKSVLNKTIEKILPEILEGVKQNREANKTAVISGTRYTLPLKGRSIDIAYYPAEKKHAPLIVAAHGGGFLFGGCALDDELWVNMTKVLDVNVASIDYRQSPDVMDEECLNDLYDSILYLIGHSQEFGFDPNHVSVFGASAGGNLAAALAIKAGMTKAFRLDNQILMYPFLDGYTDPDEKGEGSFTGLLPHVMNRLHFSPERSDDPLLSPVFASVEMLKGLPAAIVSYCEYDNLRPEAQKYCQMLKEAGVPVAEFYAEKMPHGYIENGFKDHFSDIEMNMLGEHAKDLIESGQLHSTSLRTLEFIKDNMVRP